ncbi:MAG: cysteine--tRNA ligase [Spirochaetia bacterium]|nr:cysteine--tRNA ligase [Spirochaetia bacterium]
MAFQFYNTYHRRLEEFQPVEAGKVKIYSCGPTVYDYAHIGNFRSYVFSDILRRSLKLGGYQVTHAMNITDVDDKTIKRTLEKKPDPDISDLKQYTDIFTAAFFEDIKKIGIDSFDHYPYATNYMGKMISLVQTLEEKGFAYRLDGSVYFSIAKYSDYGRLSGVDLSSIKTGTRYNTDEYTKEDVRDFVLWKSEKSGEKIAWDSPFGRGRPGWHLECSAMIESLFNGAIDIHTGGVDLMFPHHENEIAQSVNAYGHEFVRYWIHCEHLLVDGKKMSKSEGNFFTLRDLMKQGYHAKAVRYFLLSSHYRAKINFTKDALDQIAQNLRRINNFYQRLESAKIINGQENSFGEKLSQQIKLWKTDFLSHLEDDLNTARALAVFHNAIKTVNGYLDENSDSLSSGLLEGLKKLFGDFESVLNLDAPELADQNINEAPEAVSDLLKKRNEARAQKNYALSDKLRDQIHESGFVIVDTPEGSRLQKKS